eukprot:TRINITY_DN1535_c0_g1_i6.p1 TRINITY_DN1535_c0_g1~~TRINITY_DN1535_c0_g1_i6.p1  ORF type:complete len:205 (-),score=15.42 TRINITY_DN1535_c0_g1_i6:766-1380(-)
MPSEAGALPTSTPKEIAGLQAAFYVRTLEGRREACSGEYTLQQLLDNCRVLCGFTVQAPNLFSKAITGLLEKRHTRARQRYPLPCPAALTPRHGRESSPDDSSAPDDSSSLDDSSSPDDPATPHTEHPKTPPAPPRTGRPRKPWSQRATSGHTRMTVKKVREFLAEESAGDPVALAVARGEGEGEGEGLRTQYADWAHASSLEA